MIVSGLLPGGAMQVARVEAPDATDSLPVCRGTGHSSCETNWNLLRQGLTAAEVANWLGHPAQQTGPDIYIEKVVAEWRYENEGVIYFENEELRYVDMPVSFVYPL